MVEFLAHWEVSLSYKNLSRSKSRDQKGVLVNAWNAMAHDYWNFSRFRVRDKQRESGFRLCLNYWQLGQFHNVFGFFCGLHLQPRKNPEKYVQKFSMDNFSTVNHGEPFVYKLFCLLFKKWTVEGVYWRWNVNRTDNIKCLHCFFIFSSVVDRSTRLLGGKLSKSLLNSLHHCTVVL